MNDEAILPSPTSRIAALGGYLEGISFLNADPRSNFAEAFVVKALDDADVLAELRTAFSQLPELILSFDESFQGTIYKIEQIVRSSILIEPHVTDDQVAQDMRSYLAFNIMDRLEDIAELKDYAEPKRIVGLNGMVGEVMNFYLLRTPQLNFVIYFCSNVCSSED
jgi:hypothetical protein